MPLIAREPVKMLLHRSHLTDAKATVVYTGPVAAPIKENQQIGYLRVSAPNGPAREYALYAGRNVKEAGIWGKIGLAAQRLLAKPASDETESAEASAN